MNRHGMVEPSTAGAQPTATDPRAPMVTVPANRLTTSNVPRRLNRAEAQRRLPSAPTRALPNGDRDIADIGHTSKSP
jgi:hypothetical protein